MITWATIWMIITIDALNCVAPAAPAFLDLTPFPICAEQSKSSKHDHNDGTVQDNPQEPAKQRLQDPGFARSDKHLEH